MLAKESGNVATDGTGHYNLTRIGGRFVISTRILREGFALNRMVVVHTPENGSETLLEAGFIARRKAGNL